MKNGLGLDIASPRGRAFSPLSISGCVLLLRPNYTLGTWTDQSASGLNLTQGTGANQPAVSAGNIPNFDGNDVLSSTGTTNLSSAYTIFVRAELDTDGATPNGMFRYGDSLSATGEALAIYVNASRLIWSSNDSVQWFWQDAGNNWSAAATAGYKTVCVSCDGTAGSRNVRYNGTDVTAGGAFTGSFGMPSGARLVHAGQGYPITTWRMDGRLKSVVVYNSALSTANKALVEAWMASL